MNNHPTSDIYRAKFNAAMFAGLNETWCHAVARGEISLADALGNMNMDDESLPFNNEISNDSPVGYGCCNHRLDEDCGCIPF